MPRYLATHLERRVSHGPARSGVVGAAEMMRAALTRSGVEPEQVGYINAHGTSTPQGDLAETKAIKAQSVPHAYDLASRRRSP